MKVETLSLNIRPKDNSEVQVKKTGNITEIKYMKRKVEIKILKVDKDNYVDIPTGEIKTYKHTDNRSENKTNIRQTLKRLRDLINTNVTDAKNCLWITLTYSENMTDTEKLYKDFKKFNMRLQYHFKNKKLPKYEYIAAMEPQQRGAWHTHLLLIFENEPPFIPNKNLADVWGHGFVKINSLKNVDNIGAYLSAYLGDMDLTEFSYYEITKLKENEIKCITKNGKTKAIIKGARIKMYPTGFRLYRTSKGIKQPTVEKCTNAEAMQNIGESTLTYEKTIRILDDDGNIINQINYRHFNLLRKKSKQVIR